MIDYEALGRQHGEESARQCLAECVGRGSAFVDQWRRNWVDRLEERTDAMMAAGVSSLDCLAFARASWARLVELLNATADQLEPAAAAARQNRAAERADRSRSNSPVPPAEAPESPPD